jgi:hypothetical protein
VIHTVKPQEVCCVPQRAVGAVGAGGHRRVYRRRFTARRHKAVPGVLPAYPINHGHATTLRGMPQPPPRREPSMEATLGPYTQSVVSALGIGPVWAAPTVPGPMASGKDPHDTTFSRIHTPAGLISTRERVVEPKNERQTHSDARAGPRTPRTETL